MVLPPSRRRQIRDRNDRHAKALTHLDGLLTVVRPPRKVTLSQWSNAKRKLSPESSAEPGDWITDKAPYERGIMDSISDPDVPKTVVQKGAQLGITDSAILNPIGYFMDEDPCPILVVQPTIEIAEAFSTDRLAPMLRDTPALRDKVSDARTRDSSNTLRRKAFKGGYVALAGANSSASLSGRPVRVVLFDDVDRYPLSAGTEGNPIQLGVARTSAFWNRKIVIISSPGIKGISHIEREMALSTCEHWYVPCPDCGEMQVLDWERMRLEDMHHCCSSCGVYAPKYLWLMDTHITGDWKAHRPLDKDGNKVLVRGFYVSGLYNPWVDWEILRDEYISAVASEDEGDVELMKAFRNTRLGLLHDETGKKVDVDLYEKRRETYDAEIPDGVLVLTGGVDVHERLLTYEVVGWGKGYESWGIEYGMLDGDPREQDVWDLLDEAVYNRTWKTTDGQLMRVRRMAVDSGYAADFVYSYTKQRQPRAISIKGEGGLGKPFIKGQGTLTKFNQARLISLGVDTGKEEIVNRLIVSKVGPGFCHFPMLPNGEDCRGYDEEYFKGLTAESRVVKTKNGFRTYIWVKRLSQRNEPFDSRNYALAASRFPWSGIKLETMKRDIYRPPLPPEMITQAGQPFGARQGTAIGVAATPTPAQARPSGQPSKFGAQNRPVA